MEKCIDEKVRKKYIATTILIYVPDYKMRAGIYNFFFPCSLCSQPAPQWS